MSGFGKPLPPAPTAEHVRGRAKETYAYDLPGGGNDDVGVVATQGGGYDDGERVPARATPRSSRCATPRCTR